MYLQEIKEKRELDIWLKEMNLSFKARSTERIPYEEVISEYFRSNDNQSVWGVYSDEDELLGGMCLLYDVEYKNIKLAKISRVWVSVRCQHAGIGTFLMEEAEKIAIGDGREMLQLNVANIYVPAVSLYNKTGFRKYKIYANAPNTYYFIRMIKPIGDFKFSEIKRIGALIKSNIIFKILFKKDSSPSIMNRLIYERILKS